MLEIVSIRKTVLKSHLENKNILHSIVLITNNICNTNILKLDSKINRKKN